MPMVIAEGKTIFFAHVPKTGGSSVEDYLVRRFGPLTIRDRHKAQKRPGTGLITPSTHFAALDLVEFLPPNLDFSFAVVRDPMDRLLSEYRYQQGASISSRMSFSTWLRLMLKASAIEPRLFENHTRPQTDLVPEGAEIFRLEDGFDGMIGRLDAVTGTTAPDIQVGHILKRERKPMTLYRQDIEAVERFYAADYERFGYERRDTSDLPNDTFAFAREAFAAVAAPLLVARQKRKWVL